jgi:hypothetical protein
VTEGDSASYFGIADYLTLQYIFTNAPWRSSQFAMTTNGVFTPGSVTSNTIVLLSAPYSYMGLLYSADQNITVLNLPSPIFTGMKRLTNGSVSMTLNGVPGRNHVIEASTNLRPPVVWIPLRTNLTGTNGLWNYTNSPATNFPRRFFRSKEL